MSGAVDNGSVPDEAPLSDYPGRSPAFRRLMKSWGMSDQGKQNVQLMESQASDVKKVTDEELVILSSLHVRDIAIEAEVARRTIDALRLNREAVDRSTTALVEFKQESATASRRLETLTRWLIAFTCAVVLLTVVLVVHDLTR